MNLSRKELNIYTDKNKNQSKKYIKHKKEIKILLEKEKENLRTGSIKYFKKRKVSKYKRKSYLKGGGGKQEYLNTFLEVLSKNKSTEEPSLEDNKYYNFDFIFNKNANMQEIMSPESLQKEFNITAKTEEEKKEDKESRRTQN